MPKPMFYYDKLPLTWHNIDVNYCSKKQVRAKFIIETKMDPTLDKSVNRREQIGQAMMTKN